ncbi:GPI transamidase component PIG-S-like [Oscarella lobularis]|uniref:GPI transamidase component PIG-S-like n=1 Tax=Oscarella lobularis TaxID=121494 RepID=UPI003313C300
MRSEDLAPFSLSALVIAAVFIIAGLPVWWKTTAVYRAPLPVEEIGRLRDMKILYTVEVQLSGPSVTLEVAKRLEDLCQNKTALKPSLSVAYKLRISNLPKLDGASSLSSLDDTLSSSDAGDIRVHELAVDSQAANELKSTGKDIWLGCHRTVFTTDMSASLPRIAKLITNLLVRESLLRRSYQALSVSDHTQEPRTAANVKSMTAVQSKPGYQLSFNLLNSDPSDFLVQWDIKTSVGDALIPFLNRLDNISTFSIDSQILRYIDLGVTPKYHAENKTYYLSFKDLPHTINTVESRLGTFVSSNPSLEFVVYVPPPSQSPLYIKDKTGQNVASNAYLSPRWGGIVVYNPETADGEESAKAVTVPTSSIMSVFISHLKLLLGLEKPKLPEGTFLRSHSSGITDWELDGLMLRRCVENVATASAALVSLTKLLEKVKNMVIADHIQTLTATAVESIDKCVSELQSGHLVQAFLLSKIAIESAETAFYDPSMLELLYFPEDQKFAIYVPLFVPVGIPVLVSCYAVLQRWRKKTAKPES